MTIIREYKHKQINIYTPSSNTNIQRTYHDVSKENKCFTRYDNNNDDQR